MYLLVLISNGIFFKTFLLTLECGRGLSDIVFLLDSSGSETKMNFQKMLTFVQDFTRQFDIGPNNAQIGVATFSSDVHERIKLNQYRRVIQEKSNLILCTHLLCVDLFCNYTQSTVGIYYSIHYSHLPFSDKTALLAAISGIPYDAGATYTDEGLQYARTYAFLPSHGGRANASRIVIVMTDGQSMKYCCYTDYPISPSLCNVQLYIMKSIRTLIRVETFVHTLSSS